MASLLLFAALSGLAVTPVFSQNFSVSVFANPPPRPGTGSFLLASLHEQSHIYSHSLVLSSFALNVYNFFKNCCTLLNVYTLKYSIVNVYTKMYHSCHAKWVYCAVMYGLNLYSLIGRTAIAAPLPMAMMITINSNVRNKPSLGYQPMPILTLHECKVTLPLASTSCMSGRL